MDAIVAEQLTKTYRNGGQALTGISFRVRQGAIYGLLGPNGAGKSTTVRILTTLTRPDSGRAYVAGHDVLHDPSAVRHSIGYVAQASGVDKYGTGRENLTLQARLQRVPASQVQTRVDAALERLGLAEVADQLVTTYSGGMKRRLDIAMGLVHEPTVLFLDEPTTGLDPETRTALWEDLRRLRRDGNIAILLTTHYLDEVDQLCDRLAIVDDGRVVVEGTPVELKAQIRGDTVTLDIGRPSTAVVDLLRTLDTVLEIIPNGSALTARVAQGATAIPTLVTRLEHAGIGVRSVSLSRPTLDDVYLYHTGHRFRVDGDPSTPEGAAVGANAGRGRRR